MLILVGLGNPGERYAHHRHNIGFRVVDAIHRRHGFSPWRRRFQADTAEGSFGDRKVLLVKPHTYMNESGRAVGEALRFFKADVGDVLVVHDEMDLPPGKTRLKVGGGSGGHGGLKSISAHIGENYRRLRIGIGHPGAKELVNPYVLHDFSGEDSGWIQKLLDAVVENAALLADNQDQTFANRVHLAVSPDDKKRPAAATPAGDNKPAAKTEAEPEKHEGPFSRLSRLFGRST